MTSDPNIQLRVSRLENETESIYELIDGFRGETRTRFDETQARFDRIESTLGEVLQRLPEPS